MDEKAIDNLLADTPIESDQWYAVTVEFALYRSPSGQTQTRGVQITAVKTKAPPETPSSR